VHHDAELAVIGVGRGRVLMGDLGYGQQRQKDKAHHGNRWQKTRPRAASTVEMCLKPCQLMISAPSILPKNAFERILLDA